ncbi:MAG: lipoyl(octanoyl) transferase LipB [Pseudomonadota bacterium]
MSRINVRYLGVVDYEVTWTSMTDFTVQRDERTVDELWVLQHSPVFTLGQASRTEHLLNVGDIPVIQTDRGGQVTYHGPGQLVIYPLIDIERLNMGVRAFVTLIEEAMIELLDSEYGLSAYSKKDAPGVYVMRHQTETKVGSLGLRIKKGASYHGLSLNMDMDLEPFSRVNPCGHVGMRMANVSALSPRQHVASTVEHAGCIMTRILCNALQYLHIESFTDTQSD